jgi:hypothetical protein
MNNPSIFINKMKDVVRCINEAQNIMQSGPIYIDDIITISSLKIMNIQKYSNSNPYFDFLARNSHKIDLITKSLVKQKIAYEFYFPNFLQNFNFLSKK